MSSQTNGNAGLHLLLVGTAWFVSSALLSTWANTAFLNRFLSPAGHTLVRFVGSALMGLATNAFSRTGFKMQDLGKLMYALKVPALCLLIGNLANSWALQLSGITLCYTVKATIPLFTVVITRLQGHVYPASVYLSLLPTVVGVALASFVDTNFTAAGFLAALGSTVATTCMNLTSKPAIQRAQLNGLQAFTCMSCLNALVMVAVALLGLDPTLSRMLHQIASPGQTAGDGYWQLFLVAIAAVAYQSEYGLNFEYVRLVTPMAFSVTDIGRRLGIIVAGSLIFSKTLTMLNWCGVVLALSGVLLFSLQNQRGRGT